MESCRIMVYCYGKNPINFGIDRTQNGSLVAVLDFWRITLEETSSALVCAFICSANCK